VLGLSLLPLEASILNQCNNMDQVKEKTPEQKQFANELYQQISKHEGNEQYSYLDTEDNPTIGVGFNLGDSDNQKIVREMGYNVDDLINGKVRLKDNEIKRLYNKSIVKSYNDARKWLTNFDDQPDDVKKAVIDMSFNLGYTKLSKFVKTKDALMKKDYNRAADEMLDSKWARQVKGRSETLSSMVRNQSK
jgi:lysozyme